MLNRMFSQSITVSVLAISAVLTPLAARAQTEVSAKPVSLASKGPVEAALRALFAAAGIRNYVIEPTVHGFADVSLDGIPFSVALKQVLGATNPPLAADIQGGAYHVRAMAATDAPSANSPDIPPMPAQSVRINAGPVVNTQTIGGTLSTDGTVSVSMPFGADQSRFYKFGIQHYDAAMLADLATRPGGIIMIPPNFVIPANSGAPVMLGQPNVSSVGSRPAFGPAAGLGGAAGALGGPAAALGGPIAGPGGATPIPGGQVAAANVLPDGVKRIYALESDNTLVVEATPTGAANLPVP